MSVFVEERSRNLLAGTACLLIGLTIVSDPARAAPVVNGTAGCIGKNGRTIATFKKGKKIIIGFHLCGQPTTPNLVPGWTLGNYVNASEVNVAFQQQETYINQIINQSHNDIQSLVDQRVNNVAVDLSPLHQKNTEQDRGLNAHDAKNSQQDRRLGGVDNRLAENDRKNQAQDIRLDDHETRVSAAEQKNAEQDARLDDHDRKLASHETRIIGNERINAEQEVRLARHEERITGTEGAVREVSENAVFYDRDTNGRKTGGLTLNDGTGRQVQVRNVAAGKAETDAINVGQLSGALDALGGGAKVNADGTLTKPVYHVGGVNYNNVGEALTATNRLGVQYVADSQGNPTNTVILTGDGTGPVRVANVATGTADTDAVNVAQVRKARQESHAYTDQRINSLTARNSTQFAAVSRDLSKTRAEIRAGVASAMAMSALRFDKRPGKMSIAGGIGGFKGSTSIATGLGYASEDGNWRINAGLSHSFVTRNTSWNAGLSFAL